MIKIAVVGTGAIGRHHLVAITESKDCELCAICDLNQVVLSELAIQYCVPVFTDYREIVKGVVVDAVILNLPHWLHCEASIFFLEHGVHVLVEKPMANSTEECDKMILAAQKANKKLAVGHVQRYFMANRKVKEIYQSGRLGELVMFNEMRSVNYFDANRPKWFLNKSLAGGGIVMNYGAHALDKLLYILDEKPNFVTSSYGNRLNDEDIEGHAQFVVRFNNGVSASITFSGYGFVGYESTYIFTKGAIKVVDTTELWMNLGNGWEKIEVLEDGKHMEKQIREFCNYINGEKSEIVTAEYARDIIDTIEAIYKTET